jgi:hypothetical protein
MSVSIAKISVRPGRHHIAGDPKTGVSCFISRKPRSECDPHIGRNLMGCGLIHWDGDEHRGNTARVQLFQNPIEVPGQYRKRLEILEVAFGGDDIRAGGGAKEILTA